MPPCAAWRMRMRWARAATQALFQNEQAGAFSGWLLGDDVRPVSYGTAKAMQPVEGDLLEFSFAECGRCRRERIARHRSFDSVAVHESTHIKRLCCYRMEVSLTTKWFAVDRRTPKERTRRTKHGAGWDRNQDGGSSFEMIFLMRALSKFQRWPTRSRSPSAMTVACSAWARMARAYSD